MSAVYHNGPTILVINAGWEQRPLIDAARKVAGRLIAVNATADVADDLPVDRLEIIDVLDSVAILELARAENIDAVVADECDYSALSAAKVAEALGLPGAGADVAERATNKAQQRNVVGDAGLKQPLYNVCAELAQAHAAASDIGYPVVVKPIDSRGGLGVRFVHDAADLGDAFDNAVAHALSGLILVEDFIDGTQFVVDGYVFPKAGYQALAISSKRMVAGTPVSSDIICPAEVDPEIVAAVREYDAKVVAALSLRHGMTHGEYMVDANGDVHLVEMANRGGGVWISTHYVPAICGIDTTQQLVEDALATGRDLYEEADGAQSRAARVHFLIPPSDAVLSAVLGEAEARALDGVESLWVKPVTGERIQGMTTDLDRQGLAILSADTPAQVDEVLAQLQQTLIFKTEEAAE